MEVQPSYVDQFVHIRIIVGMVLGISLSRLVSGLARFVQHPTRQKIYSVHLGWVLYMLLAIIHFWWYEFSLARIQVWTFGLYFFIIFFAILFALAASLLFPDQITDYASYEDYFQSRRKWFYGLLAVLSVTDLVDTAIKGAEHFRALGYEYPIQQGVLVLCAVIAIFVPSKKYQGAFVITALVYKALWIFRLFDVLK